MLHHVSFNARNPEVAAKGIAKLVQGTALQAPCPPFPTGSWFVCLGDEHGSFLEVLAWGHVQDPAGSVAQSVDNQMRERTGTHVLLQTPLSVAQIRQLAQEQGWSHSAVDTGLFEITRVWVEGSFLIELMTAEQSKSYKANFGTQGMPTLNAKLREMEQRLQKMMG
jgi:hypothetical protein